MGKEEIILFAFIVIMLAAFIYVLYVFSNQEIVGQEVPLTFKEKSNEVLSLNIEIPTVFRIPARIFFGIGGSVLLQDFAVIIASFILFFLFFLDALELTSMKGWLIGLLSVVSTVLAGLIGLIKIVGLFFFRVFGFLDNSFYQIIAVFVLVVVLMWFFSLVFGRIKKKIVEGKEIKRETEVGKIREEYKL